jgi:hypothetical protein
MKRISFAATLTFACAMTGAAVSRAPEYLQRHGMEILIRDAGFSRASTQAHPIRSVSQASPACFG